MIAVRYSCAPRVLQKGLVLCFSADIGDVNVANSIFLRDRRRMMYLSGTSNSDGLKSAASSLIQWEAIKTAVEEGIDVYDLGGIGIQSIDKFKKSFGGFEIQRTRWSYRSWSFGLIEPIGIWAREKGLIGI